MSDSLQKPTESVLLGQWLSIATRGLCDEAQARIEKEVRRHVEETVVELETTGVSENASLADAVRQLGKPNAANRAYRRANWTKGEHMLLANLPDRVGLSIRGWRTMHVLIILALFEASFVADMLLMIFGMGFDATRTVLFWTAFGLGPIALLGAPLALRYLLSRGRLKLAVATASAGTLLSCMSLVMAYSIAVRNTTLLDPFVLYLLLLAILPSIRFQRLWRKLGWISPPTQAGS